VPSGVVCLLSALRFHELTTQSPHQVWLALDRKSRKPRLDLPVRIVRFSGEVLSAGCEVHVIEQVPVKIFGPAKTVADCFHYRKKIGVDVAIEALKDCLRQRKATVDDLWRYAKVCRVANVMRPYMESVV
jgi:predicted transcriptional regulator of viral defense system